MLLLKNDMFFLPTREGATNPMDRVHALQMFVSPLIEGSI